MNTLELFKQFDGKSIELWGVDRNYLTTELHFKADGDALYLMEKTEFDDVPNAVIKIGADSSLHTLQQEHPYEWKYLDEVSWFDDYYSYKEIAHRMINKYILIRHGQSVIEGIKQLFK